MQKADSAAKICLNFLKNQTNFGRCNVLGHPVIMRTLPLGHPERTILSFRANPPPCHPEFHPVILSGGKDLKTSAFVEKF